MILIKLNTRIWNEFFSFYFVEKEYILSKLEEKTEKLEEMKNELSFEKRKLEAPEESKNYDP